MKKILLSAFFLLSLALVSQAQTAAPENKNQAEIQFEEETHDFGTFKEGSSVTYEFKFKNIGKEPLVLLNAVAGCGCTKPTIPKEPIAAGKTGVIKVTFNSTGKPGQLNKAITVTSNAKTSTKILTIRGYVEKPPAEPTELKSPVVEPNNPSKQ
jgi:archaellum component FlaG (FlaF/FlaG flagellin family)